MDQHRFDWRGQLSFMNRYDTQQLLGYSSLSLSQALSALQPPDFAANSCGIHDFGLREYVRLHNLVQDEKLTFNDTMVFKVWILTQKIFDACEIGVSCPRGP